MIGRSQYLCHAGAHPVASGVRVLARELHCRQVLLPQIAVGIEHARLDVHAIARTRGFQEPGCDLVSQAARAEVHADPDPVLLVGEQIDVVIARAHGAQLLPRQLLQPGRSLRLPSLALFEQRMLDALIILASDAEADRAPHFVHDAGDVAP
jgi:hypothetical protein